METNTRYLAIANESGFPLQIAVERSVQQSTAAHGWSVRYTEHAWSNKLDDRTGFVDLVLQDRYKSTYLVIECKRVRNTTWLFMHPDGQASPRRHAKAWVSHSLGGDKRFRHFSWHDVPLDPATPEACFCAVRGTSTNDKATLLERIGGELISSTEALALEEKDFRITIHETIRFYFNVIVTTADLKIAKFDPSATSLDDGTLTHGQVIDVPYVRFRKQLSPRNAVLTPDDYKDNLDVAYSKQHTVFVVRANALLDFLQEFEIPQGSVDQFTSAVTFDR